MISRRNFMTIVIMMAILFFLFQFTSVAKEALNEYGVNTYENETFTALTAEEAIVPAAEEIKNQESKKRGHAVFIGEPDDGAAGEAVQWWCTYSKRSFFSYDSLKDYGRSDTELPEVLILDSRHLDFSSDTKTLEEYMKQGIHLIFANLPEAKEIEKNEELCRLLGIRYIRSEQTTLKGLHLFAGFLLGGERIYEAENESEQKRQDLDLTIPWYVLDTGTKGYLMGTMEDEKLENEELPAIIWRKSTEHANLFAVNGDYLSGMNGIGILEAMMAELHPYELYPIVNAQNLVLANFSGLASENEEEIKRRYSQDQMALFREIIWPGMLSAAKKNNDRITCLLTPQYDYEDENEPDGDSLLYYLKLLKEEYGEAGISGNTVSETALSEKMQSDSAFMETYAPDYAVLSYYLKDEELLEEILSAKELQDLRTVALDMEEADGAVVSYAAESVTLQRATSSGIRHTFRDDLRVKSIETALGYSNIVLDLMPAAYPKEEEDSWEKMAKEITGNLGTFWKSYSVFSSTTLSESDQRIRRFLALDYEEERRGDTITLSITGFEEEAWFLLRLHEEEPFDCAGASFTEVEPGTYLIEAVSESVVLRVKPENESYFYEE